MTTEITYPNFIESAQNLEALNNYMYLLNFWHISKINKEREYIKRHGLHPLLKDFISGAKTQEFNTFSVDGPSDIQKMVFTVFRIYLEKKIPEFEVSKVRDQATWVFTLNNDSFGLDNPMFLMVNSLRLLNRDNFPIFSLRNLSQDRYSRRTVPEKFSIKYDNISSGLLITQLEKDFTEIENALAIEVDGLINHSLRRLMGLNTFLENLGIDPKAKAKPVRKKDSSDDWIELEVTPRGQVMTDTPVRAVTTPEVQSLVELYRTLGSPMSHLQTTDLMNYLIAYTRAANPERRVPQLTPATIREFQNSINNAA